MQLVNSKEGQKRPERPPRKVSKNRKTMSTGERRALKKKENKARKRHNNNVAVSNSMLPTYLSKYYSIDDNIKKVWFFFPDLNKFKIDYSDPFRMFKYSVLKEELTIDGKQPFVELEQYVKQEAIEALKVVLGFRTPYSEEGRKLGYKWKHDLINTRVQKFNITAKEARGKKMPNPLNKSKRVGPHKKKWVTYKNNEGKEVRLLRTFSRLLMSHTLYNEVASHMEKAGDDHFRQISRRGFAILHLHGAFDNIVGTSYSRNYNFKIPLWQSIKQQIGNSKRGYNEEDIRFFISQNMVKPPSKKKPIRSKSKALVCVNFGAASYRMSRAEAEFLMKWDKTAQYTTKTAFKQLKNDPKTASQAKTGLPEGFIMPIKRSESLNKLPKTILGNNIKVSKKEGLKSPYIRHVRNTGKPRLETFEPNKGFKRTKSMKTAEKQLPPAKKPYSQGKRSPNAKMMATWQSNNGVVLKRSIVEKAQANLNHVLSLSSIMGDTIVIPQKDFETIKHEYRKIKASLT